MFLLTSHLSHWAESPSTRHINCMTFKTLCLKMDHPGISSLFLMLKYSLFVAYQYSASRKCLRARIVIDMETKYRLFIHLDHDQSCTIFHFLLSPVFHFTRFMSHLNLTVWKIFVCSRNVIGQDQKYFLVGPVTRKAFIS